MHIYTHICIYILRAIKRDRYAIKALRSERAIDNRLWGIPRYFKTLIDIWTWHRQQIKLTISLSAYGWYIPCQKGSVHYLTWAPSPGNWVNRIKADILPGKVESKTCWKSKVSAKAANNWKKLKIVILIKIIFHVFFFFWIWHQVYCVFHLNIEYFLLDFRITFNLKHLKTFAENFAELSDQTYFRV